MLAALPHTSCQFPGPLCLQWAITEAPAWACRGSGSGTPLWRAVPCPATVCHPDLELGQSSWAEWYLGQQLWQGQPLLPSESPAARQVGDMGA